ncbi:Ig-like domain-containing protein [Patescibacteria group bacterium]|nr:Ig-like domain-containing protein [Patescibacteria group bacterium]
MNRTIVKLVVIIIILAIALVGTILWLNSHNQIAAITPTDQSTDVNILSPIQVTFAKPFDSNAQKMVTFWTSPDTSGKITWSDDGKTVTYTPQPPLTSSQKYIAKVTYLSNQNFIWSFSTTAFNQLTPEQQTQAQQQADQNVANQRNDLLQKYPWFLKLPIQKLNYFVYFDPTTEEFTAKIYTNNTQVSSADLQKQVLIELQTLGIDTNKYKINWEINPSS